MSLSIRAKTVVKLQSETVNIDLETQKGASLVGLIKTLIQLIDNTEDLTKVSNYLLLRKTKLEESGR